jgi:H+/Cl- antiporter ClcA
MAKAERRIGVESLISRGRNHSRRRARLNRISREHLASNLLPHLPLAVAILARLLVKKFLAVVVNHVSAGSGGLFSSTLFLGGILGGLMPASLDRLS